MRWSSAMQLIAAGGLWLLAQHDALTPWRMMGPLVLGGLAAGFQYAPSQALLPFCVVSFWCWGLYAGCAVCRLR